MKKVGQLFRESLLKDVKEGIRNNGNAFILSYSNITSLQLSDLRKDLKRSKSNMYVVKNSVAKRALKELKHDYLADIIKDQTAFIWSNSESADISKILVKFAKDLDNTNVQGGIVDGAILTQSDVIKLSDLPSREVLLSMLLSTIQSPLTRLAGALNAKTRDLLSILKQLSEKKGGN